MRRTVRSLCIAKWSDYQHYKDGKLSPPWIKFHARLLVDREFARMPETTQLAACKLLLLASQERNHVPADPAWIAERISCQSDIKAHLEGLLATEFLAACECPECAALPPVDWLETHSRLALDPRARARVFSLSSDSSSSLDGDRGPGEGVELEPLPPALARIKLPQQLLTDHHLEGLATVADAWQARLTAPNIRTPGRADQLGQIAALERAVATYGEERVAALVVTALVKTWRGFDDAMVADRLGERRNGHHKTSARQAEATAGIDPDKLRKVRARRGAEA